MANMLKNSHAVSKTALVSIIVVVLAVCVIAGFTAYQVKPTTPIPTPTPTPSTIVIPTATPTTIIPSAPNPTPIQTDDPHISSIEKIIIQSVGYDSSNKIVTVYAQSTGEATPVVNSLIVKDQSGNTIVKLGIGTISPTATGNALSKGTMYTIPSTVYSTGLATGTYTATLATNAGGSFVSPSFTVSSEAGVYQ
jgi:hypothetical protein